MVNIGTLLPRHAQYRPNHLALVFEERRLTFNELNERVNRLANGLLELGLSKVDKIATILPNCLEQLEVYWAVAKLGAVVVPLSPLLQRTGLARVLNDSDTVLVITTAAFVATLDTVRADLPAIASDRYFLTEPNDVPGYRAYDALTADAASDNPPSVTINRDDPYNIIYSSGTTGLPKGIVHTHAIRAAYCSSFASAYRMTPESRVLHVGSIVFNGAFLTLMPAMFLGCPYILHRQFDATALIETVAREKVRNEN